MWPILIGFMFGVVVYVAVMWVHNQYGTLNDILDDIRVPFWLRALLVLMTSAMCLAALFLFVHVWPPLTVTFEHTMKGWELFWAIFYGSNFLSVFLGFVLGIFVTDWVVDARRANAAHVGKRGIAIAVFTAITILVGLDHNLNFLNRVNKVSTSVISFELDNRHAANNRTTGPSGAVGSTWSASEPISTALSILADLAKLAMERDKEVAEFISETKTLIPPKENHAEQFDATAKFFADYLRPFVIFRKSIHSVKRDANPIFFYTERLHSPEASWPKRSFIGQTPRNLRRLCADRSKLRPSRTNLLECLGVSTFRITSSFSKAPWQQMARPYRSSGLSKIRSTIFGRPVNRLKPSVKVCAAILWAMLQSSGLMVSNKRRAEARVLAAQITLGRNSSSREGGHGWHHEKNDRQNERTELHHCRLR